MSLTTQQASPGLREPRSGRFQSSEQASTDVEILCKSLVVSLFGSAPRPKQVLGGLLIQGVKTLTLPFFKINFTIYFQLCWAFTAAQAFLYLWQAGLLSRVAVLRRLAAVASSAAERRLQGM